MPLLQQPAVLHNYDEPEDEELTPSEAKTDPAHCIITGDGTTAATTRKLSVFHIETFDAAGIRRNTGGDLFLVTMRGCGEMVRVKVVDLKDGKYVIEYKPIVSGKYQISVSLCGVQLPGSPFRCLVSTPTASAPHCILRGSALLKAIARKEEYFEIQFRDFLGQVAHAEELDVYVEPVGEQELTEIKSAKAEEEAEVARLKEEEEAEIRVGKTKKEREQLAAAAAAEKKKAGSDLAKSSTEDSSGISPFHAPRSRSSRPPGAEGFIPLLKTHDCTVTSAKPLIVRASVAKGSPRVGHLMPGQRLRLLEVVMVDEGNGQQSARASVALVDDSVGKPDVPNHHDWRNSFVQRPAWLDGIPTPRKQRPNPLYRVAMPFGPGSSRLCAAEQSAPSEPEGMAIGWVTVHKGRQELVTPRGGLQAGERQRHMQQWARRIAIDKSITVTSQQRMLRQGSSGAVNPTQVDGVSRRRKKAQEDTASSNGRGQSVYTHELKSDPKGIGFAFGGVDPGRLHAHGQIHETHKVHYSIAMCGMYKLHVALRHERVELPGSPYLLHVSAGPASALSTRLPEDALPLAGVVGTNGGCQLTLLASDKMGNRCTTGGASVSCSSAVKDQEKVDSRVIDNDDGTYTLEWKSKHSGYFEVNVTIDGLDVLGSPTMMRLISDMPDLRQTDISGPGLRKAIAGKSTHFKIRCKDTYGNPAEPGSLIKFEMALLRVIETNDKATSKAEKATIAERWKTATPLPWEVAKEDKEHDEEVEIHYIPKMAGNLELHIWALRSAQGRSERLELPGMPYILHCTAGKAHAGGSSVEGFTRLDAVSNDRKGQAAAPQSMGSKLGMAGVVAKRSSEREATCSYELSNEIFAGEPIIVRPKIRDKLGNNTAAPDGALEVTLNTPDGGVSELLASISLRHGLTNYDVRYEPQVAGFYQMNVKLKGAPVAGSPVTFECIPNLPDVSKSNFVVPTDTPALLSNKNYIIKVVTRDRCGNQLDHGGSHVIGRLQSANLPPQQNTVLDVEDKEDGTYELKINLQAASELKVIISIDKDRQGDGGGEFPPIPMTFQSLEAINKKLAKLAKQAGTAVDDSCATSGGSFQSAIPLTDSEESPMGTPKSSERELDNPFNSATGSGGKMRAKMREAGSAIIEGFGKAADRREKTAAMAVVADMAMESRAVEVPIKRAFGSFGLSSGGTATSSVGSADSNAARDSIPQRTSSPPRPRRESSANLSAVSPKKK